MSATFRLAAPADLEQLLILNREFCALDQHPFVDYDPECSSRKAFST
jgi:hypothetical protein